MAENPFLTEFNTSLTRIQELVRERQANNNQLLTLITDNITAIDEKVAERLEKLQEEFPNHEYTEQEKATIYENVQNEPANVGKIFQENRSELVIS